MNTIELINFHPTGMNACTMDNDAYEEAARTWLCVSCGTPKPSTSVVHVKIQETSPLPTPLTFVYGCGVILAHRDLLRAIPPELVNADLMIGAVYDSSDIKFRDWVTIRARQRIIVRGSKQVSCRICESCGRYIYFALGKRYLYPAPPEGHSIYESDLHGLVVRSGVMADESLRSWPKLGVEKISVFDSPLDSLGDLITR